MKSIKTNLFRATLAILLVAGLVVAAPAAAADYFKTVQGTTRISSPGFIGSGLNDMTVAGVYTGAENKCYEVIIDATGTPDTFKWRANCSFGAYTAGVSITGSAQSLGDGVSITFGATTGHASGAKWTFSASSINPMKIMSGDGTVVLGIKNDQSMSINKIDTGTAALPVTTSSLDVTGAATVSGNTALSGTLGVTGDSTFGAVMSMKKVAATNFAVTTPGLTFDTTLDIPAGAVIVGVRMRLDTAITGAGNADRVGIGDASCTDPDKYAETTALTANAKNAAIPDWTVLGSEESIFICAMQDATQAATGNIGGADETITVEVSYFEINALPNL